MLVSFFFIERVIIAYEKASIKFMTVFFSINVLARISSSSLLPKFEVGDMSGMWNQTALDIVLLARMICDQYLRPSLYLSKLDVVLYEMTKPSTVPTLKCDNV